MARNELSDNLQKTMNILAKKGVQSFSKFPKQTSNTPQNGLLILQYELVSCLVKYKIK